MLLDVFFGYKVNCEGVVYYVVVHTSLLWKLSASAESEVMKP